MDLEAKIVAKSSVLAVNDETTFGPLTIVDIDDLLVGRILFKIFQNSESKSFAFDFGLDCLCIAAICIYKTSPVMIAGSSKYSKCPTTQFQVIDFALGFTVFYSCSTFKG